MILKPRTRRLLLRLAGYLDRRAAGLRRYCRATIPRRNKQGEV